MCAMGTENIAHFFYQGDCQDIRKALSLEINSMLELGESSV